MEYTKYNSSCNYRGTLYEIQNVDSHDYWNPNLVRYDAINKNWVPIVPLGSTNYVNPIIFKDRMIFSDSNTLWSSDGTTQGTIALCRRTQVFWPAVSNDHLYFAARTQNAFNLWTSDGTVEGTYPLESPQNISWGDWNNGKTFKGNYYFSMNDGVHGQELWRTNWTPEGTRMVRDIRSGIESSNPHTFTEVNGHLYFIADDGIHGSDVWEVDAESDRADTGSAWTLYQ